MFQFTFFVSLRFFWFATAVNQPFLKVSSILALHNCESFFIRAWCDVPAQTSLISPLSWRDARQVSTASWMRENFVTICHSSLEIFAEYFQNIIHFVGVRVSQYGRRWVSTRRNVSFENNCLQADKENLIFFSPHYQLSNFLTFLFLDFMIFWEQGLGTLTRHLWFFNRNLNH